MFVAFKTNQKLYSFFDFHSSHAGILIPTSVKERDSQKTKVSLPM